MRCSSSESGTLSPSRSYLLPIPGGVGRRHPHATLIPATTCRCAFIVARCDDLEQRTTSPLVATSSALSGRSPFGRRDRGDRLMTELPSDLVGCYLGSALTTVARLTVIFWFLVRGGEQPELDRVRGLGGQIGDTDADEANSPVDVDRIEETRRYRRNLVCVTERPALCARAHDRLEVRKANLDRDRPRLHFSFPARRGDPHREFARLARKRRAVVVVDVEG